MGYPDRLILFDLAGPMAHFRKFYTNSSSLSYSFPPRTTLCGLIAGILGKPRDSYYEEFSLARCRIGLSLRKPVRKIIQIVNYVRTKSLSEVNASAGHTQVPLELILPLPGDKRLIYRIYFWHEDDELMGDLWRRLREKKFIYPPYLGITECLTEIPWASVVKEESLDWITDSGKPLKITTVVPVSRLENGGCILQEGTQILRDRLPFDFKPDRSLAVVDDILYEMNSVPLLLQLRGDIFHIVYSTPQGERDEYGLFMEKLA